MNPMAASFLAMVAPIGQSIRNTKPVGTDNASWNQQRQAELDPRFIGSRSPLQAIDQSLQELPILCVDVRQVLEGTNVSAITAGIRDGNPPLVHVNPEIGPPADLGEQPQHVVGPKITHRRVACSRGPIGPIWIWVHVAPFRWESSASKHIVENVFQAFAGPDRRG